MWPEVSLVSISVHSEPVVHRGSRGTFTTVYIQTWLAH
uniref:Uncharacterized protein n=1 Tax=Anguilla anguilla TaxID=7936 RepID=A0A0E9W412_ANGAN